jgi:hypothetical protein
MSRSVEGPPEQGCLDEPPVSADHQPSMLDPAVEPSSMHRKKRTVYFTDPDYYEHLPPHLQHLKELPFFVDGAIDFNPPSYEIEIDDDSEGGSDTLDPSQS